MKIGIFNIQFHDLPKWKEGYVTKNLQYVSNKKKKINFDKSEHNASTQKGLKSI